MDGIITPEAVVLEVETAGVSSRMFAGLLDLMIQTAFVGLALAILAVTGFADSSSADRKSVV